MIRSGRVALSDLIGKLFAFDKFPDFVEGARHPAEMFLITALFLLFGFENDPKSGSDTKIFGGYPKNLSIQNELLSNGYDRLYMGVS